MSASRLYLQVHYPSDILAGIALVSGWVLGVNAIYHHQTRDRGRRDVLLRLPGEVIGAYRHDAQTRGVDDDDVVGEILARHYGVTAKNEQETQTAPARVRVRER